LVRLFAVAVCWLRYVGLVGFHGWLRFTVCVCWFSVWLRFYPFPVLVLVSFVVRLFTGLFRSHVPVVPRFVLVPWFCSLRSWVGWLVVRGFRCSVRLRSSLVRLERSGSAGSFGLLVHTFSFHVPFLCSVRSRSTLFVITLGSRFV